MGKNTGLKRWSILRSPWCKLNKNCTDFEDFLWFLCWCVTSHSFTHSDYQPYLLLQIIWDCLQNFLHTALIIQHQNKTKTILCMYVCVHVYVRYLSICHKYMAGVTGGRRHWLIPGFKLPGSWKTTFFSDITQSFIWRVSFSPHTEFNEEFI